MPKREDIKNILLIGSGPIVIGQACEFDYSGTQAIKTLKNLNYRVVLINSNPATIMTDPEFADRTYIEPITKENIVKICHQENIDAILPTMGGQTALNAAMEVFESGELSNVEFLGAKPEAIKKGEDRQKFKEAMVKIGINLPKSGYAHNMQEAWDMAEKIGFPLIIRASFTLAGGGSGVAYNKDEFEEIVRRGIKVSPINEILIEESLLGWKEYEMEVIRDKNDNCIIVCGIENIDPMGVHTGDSVTVAPILTLTDKEYQNMRNASFATLREIGVDTGGSNVQFAINPQTGRMVVIEMNPRVSRSSALASKATGYPIAKVATLLAVGFSLDEITNDITQTPASFEPTIDYIVTKMPRFTFEKFPDVQSTLTTAMKSVGEIMAIGATFKESFLKALCSLEVDISGFMFQDVDEETLIKEIRRPNANRFLYIAQAFRMNKTVDEVFSWCQVDPWFLREFMAIVNFEQHIDIDILAQKELLHQAKIMGFSDNFIAQIISQKSGKNIEEHFVHEARKRLGIVLKYEEVDTCAGEFATQTAYLYSTPQLNESSAPACISKKQKKKILIIGSGPNCIGQGIEFDYTCVHSSFAAKEAGYETIMYNCNPETVSTDYDISDVLYFEPIDFERVSSVIEREKPSGVIVQFGGQTPLKLANKLTLSDARIIGTSAKIIDLAEDREKFSKFVEKNGLLQSENGTAIIKEQAYEIAKNIGYPILVRPSYVLGGRAMRIVYDENELKIYMQEAAKFNNNSPVLIDKFLDGALELDVDAVCDGQEVYIGGIMQHIEEAGVHSGDSACVLPAINIDKVMLKQIKAQTKKVALGLGVNGLLNIQFAIFQSALYLIEVNPRASRTIPFVSKATGVPLAKVATRVMLGHDLKEALNFYAKNRVDFDALEPKKIKHISVKEAVFPFNKLLGADVGLGPEMKSTGEVMGIANDFGSAFYKAELGAKNTLPNDGTVFLSVNNQDKNELLLKVTKKFKAFGFKILATSGTAKFLNGQDVEVGEVLKISEGRPNIEDAIKNEDIHLCINTISSKNAKDDGRHIKSLIVKNNICYFTTVEAANIATQAIESYKNGHTDKITCLQDYLKK